ncbi:hypothetical protein SAMN04488082_12110 [Desulfomicrobium apsheronum]|uniref:Lipoprotein n=1 Tax=Desulfomicrobium apsheronum TaxID=52560 RepID=A0A1I3YUH3_9BACT|nr:hypothetical protein [Desulfomicrobium apsheronum]MDY0226905.1 hypothetical protein [Desulfomicrobium apsheronum]SFK34891.1 hypothetical protein SAMN04488082_12110 [Desulfomicrobium apsheronum]
MRPRLILSLVIAVLLLTGCAHLSVVHLDKNPWTLGQQETLVMRYWEFNYTSRLEDNRLIVSGTAIPVAGAIPEWATWIQDLWMQIYLSDDQSRVLAKDLRLYLPTSLDHEKGVPFEFHLTPESLGSSGPLYISFGYRMELTAEKNTLGAAGTSQVFFASQGALFQ